MTALPVPADPAQADGGLLPREVAEQQGSQPAQTASPFRCVRDCDLADITHLPWAFRRLALHVLRDPRTSSDHLLILADGIAEAAEASRLQEFRRSAGALDTLADALRALAPRYATP